MLQDHHNRIHDYLRISLTERCNLRCEYCMPLEGISLRDKSHFMTSEEVIRIAKTFVNLGVKKIRITGGEPLIKKDIANILTQLSLLNVELALTTNGILLGNHFELLQNIGVKKLNISLDSLKENVFNSLSRRNYFQQIMGNIQEAIQLGFDVQLNMVVIRGINELEVVDFIEWTRNTFLSIRFIEFMPFDDNKWNTEKVVPQRELMSQINTHFGADAVLKLDDAPNSTSRNFTISGFKGSFGFISTISQPFCATCNRIRLTADGKIKNCLFSNEETDLLNALRNGEDLETLIHSSIYTKHKKHAGIDFTDSSTIHENRTMTAIGG